MDLRSQLLLNAVQVETIFPVDQVDSKTEVTETSRSTDAMEVGLRVLWKIEIDNNVDSLNIDTTGEQIGADEIAHCSVSEVVKYAISMLLQHLGMRVEARVAQLCDLLR